MKKRAIIIVSYEDDQELTKFVAANGDAVAEVSAIYDGMDAADIEDILNVEED